MGLGTWRGVSPSPGRSLEREVGKPYLTGLGRVARDKGGIRFLRVLASQSHFSAHAKAMFLQLNRAMRFGTPNIKNCGVGYSVIWSDLCYPDY